MEMAISAFLPHNGGNVSMLNCQGHERRLLQETGVFAKLVLIVLLIVVAFVVGIGTLARVFFRTLSGLRPDARRGLGGRPPFRFGNEEKVERMLACSVCGVHVPESEGIEVAGKFFCCEAHRK